MILIGRSGILITHSSTTTITSKNTVPCTDAHEIVPCDNDRYDAEVASTSRFSRLMHALRKRADNRDQNTLVGEGPLPASCFH